jgi:nucleotide-binding universal stress UspA family protein
MPQPEPPESGPPGLRRICACTDFSETARHAFGYALDAATRRPGCTLYLLHVIPEPEAQFWKTYIYELEDVDAKARRDVDAKLAADYLPRVPEGLDFHVEVRIGKASAAILDFVREREVDLIVLGRHGHSVLGELLYGGVTDKVARKAHCPVLVVPAPREGDPASE